MDNFYILSDGSNIALHRKTPKKKAKFQNLVILKKYVNELKELFPIEWEIVVDATLRHRINNKEALEKEIRTGVIVQCPCKVEADAFILEFFKNHPENTLIISNDGFEKYTIPNLVVFRYSILFDEFITIPNLKEYLESQFGNILEAKPNV